MNVPNLLGMGGNVDANALKVFLEGLASGAGGGSTSTLPLFEDFGLRANGAVPATAASGQALAVHPGANGAVSIANGLAVTSASANGAAFYIEAVVSEGPVRYLRGSGKFASGGTGAAAGCIGVFNHSVGAANPFTGLGSPCHGVVMPTQFDYGVFLGGDGTGPDNYKYQSFSYADVGTDVWTVEMAWDPDRGIAAFRDPYGTVHRVTNSDVLGAIDIDASVAFCEVQYVNAATNKRLGIASFGADVAPSEDSASVSRGELLLLEAVLPADKPVWRIGKSSANVATNTVSALANIATDLDVTFVAPPSGAVVFTIGCTIDYAEAGAVGLLANLVGTNGGLCAAYTASAEVAPSRRRHQATIVKSGLVPGETYSATPQTYTGMSAQIIIDAVNFDSAVFVVEPVVD